MESLSVPAIHARIHVLCRVLKAALIAMLSAVMTFVLDVKDIIRMKILLRTRALPPGPPRYPILGSLLSMRSGGLPHEALTELGKQYGPVMLMYFGSKRAVVISSREICEAMYTELDEKVAMRPHLFAHDETNAKSIIAFGKYGPEWRFFKRLCFQEVVSTSRLNASMDQRQLRTLDLVHSVLETSKLEGLVEGPWMRNRMTMWAFESLGELLLGESYFWESSAEVREALAQEFRTSAILNIAEYVRPIKPFAAEFCRPTLANCRKTVHGVYESIIAQKLPKVLARKEGEPLETVLDVLLSQAQEPPGREYLTDENIKSFLTEIILGGTDGVAATLEWTFLEMMRHPKVLKRAHEELDAAVGKERLVSELDLPQLPYIKAIVKETLRLHLPGPLLVPRLTPNDIAIAGYHIPAGTILFINAYAIHRDPKVWEKPLEFYPERFLAPGKSTTLDSDLKDISYLPFGGGRRICPGRSLTAVMLQCCIAQMIHTIEWTLPNDEKPEDIDPSDDHSYRLPLHIAKPQVQLSVVTKPRLPVNVIYPSKDLAI